MSGSLFFLTLHKGMFYVLWRVNGMIIYSFMIMMMIIIIININIIIIIPSGHLLSYKSSNAYKQEKKQTNKKHKRKGRLKFACLLIKFT